MLRLEKNSNRVFIYQLINRAVEIKNSINGFSRRLDTLNTLPDPQTIDQIDNQNIDLEKKKIQNAAQKDKDNIKEM